MRRLHDTIVRAILDGINWDEIPCRTTEVLFKRLKEEIIRLKDEGRVLMRFNELRETLQLRLSGEFKRFADEELRAVLTLLAGPGVVWELAFGSWVLLQPERINAYAQAALSLLPTLSIPLILSECRRQERVREMRSEGQAVIDNESGVESPKASVSVLPNAPPIVRCPGSRVRVSAARRPSRPPSWPPQTAGRRCRADTAADWGVGSCGRSAGDGSSACPATNPGPHLLRAPTAPRSSRRQGNPSPRWISNPIP